MKSEKRSPRKECVAYKFCHQVDSPPKWAKISNFESAFFPFFFIFFFLFVRVNVCVCMLGWVVGEEAGGLVVGRGWRGGEGFGYRGRE